jgi:hypothetical protein
MRNLTTDETRSLRCVAGMMIPTSTAHGVPGADDDTIFTDIVGSIGRDMAQVKQALQHLDRLAGGVFADSDLATRHAAATAFQKEGGAEPMALNRVVAQCYYRDDRVMRSLGMDVRAPFPKGFEVEQGDWSLLDPVRSRPAFYRRTS